MVHGPGGGEGFSRYRGVGSFREMGGPFPTPGLVCGMWYAVCGMWYVVCGGGVRVGVFLSRWRFFCLPSRNDWARKGSDPDESGRKKTGLSTMTSGSRGAEMGILFGDGNLQPVEGSGSPRIGAVASDVSRLGPRRKGREERM